MKKQPRVKVRNIPDCARSTNQRVRSICVKTIGAGSVWLSGLMLMLLLTAKLTAGTLTGSYTSVAPGSDINLTTNALDWVHWGLYTDTSLNRKATVTPQVSDFSLLGASGGSGFTYAFQLADNFNGYSWSDGTPIRGVTNTTTGVWAYNFVPLGSGFQFTVPADTSVKTLRVYVGAYNARGQFTAVLSDNSAPGYTDTSLFNVGSGPASVYTVSFAANSAGQTLTIRWTVSRSLGQTPNVSLQAAGLTAADTNSPPYAHITSPAINTKFSAPATISINATAADADGSVTNVEFYANGAKVGQDTTDPYSFTWNSAPAGHYLLTVRPMDNNGRATTSSPVDIFVHGTGGSLAGNMAFPPWSVNLTEEGTADWTHWGLVTNTSFNYKNSVQRQISNFTRIGTNVVERLTDNYTVFSWNDGIPVSSASYVTNAVFIRGYANGFGITAPASATVRTLRVYVSLYGTEGNFQAWLSDFSAPAYTDLSLNSPYGNSYAVYTLIYSAASSGQTLQVRFTSGIPFDMDSGNVALQAATLQGGLVEPLPVRIVAPMRIGNDFVMSFLTQSNFNYLVKYSASLSPPSWTDFATVPGTGGMITVTNQNATADARYYGVETQ